MRLTIASGVATFAAAILLYPLFQGGAWLWTSLGAVLAVMAVGLLSTRLSLPAWAAPLLGVLATWIYLTAAFAADEAWALLVPTKESVAELARLLGVGWADIQRFGAPVPELEGITLLTAGAWRSSRSPWTCSPRGCAGRRWPGCRCWRWPRCRPRSWPTRSVGRRSSWPRSASSAC
ncbi:hypothetical protein ACFQYP_30055 [Nonomuraea antimicrobica]